MTMPANAEEWRPIAGFEDRYEISTMGRIRTLRGAAWTKNRDGILQPFANRVGAIDSHCTYQVRLWNGQRYKSIQVGRTVLEEFVGPCPVGLECCHFNDDPRDNRLANLRWDTRSSNLRDQVRNGRHPHANKGECPQGHQYDSRNTRITKKGSRRCRKCDRDEKRAARGLIGYSPGQLSSSLCGCGCGEFAPIATQTNRSKGYVKGLPLRFRSGHSLKRSVA